MKDEILRLFIYLWNWWWSWEMVTLWNESIFVSGVLQVDLLSLGGNIRVSSLNNLDWVLWVWTWLYIAILFVLGPIAQFGQPPEGPISIVLVLTASDHNLVGVLSGAVPLSGTSSNENGENCQLSKIQILIKIPPHFFTNSLMR